MDSLLSNKSLSTELVPKFGPYDTFKLTTQPTTTKLRQHFRDLQYQNYDTYLLQIINQWTDEDLVHKKKDDIRKLLRDINKLDSDLEDYLCSKLLELAIEIKKSEFVMNLATIIDISDEQIHMEPANNNEENGHHEYTDSSDNQSKSHQLRSYQLKDNTENIDISKCIAEKCEGCNKKINFEIDKGILYVDKYEKWLLLYETENRDQFYFHNEYCLVFRKLKENIRQYVVDKSEGSLSRDEQLKAFNLKEKLPKPLIHLFKHTHQKYKDGEELPEDYEQMKLVRKEYTSGEERLMSYRRTYASYTKQLHVANTRNKNEVDESFEQIQYTNLNIYGKSLLKFIILQLLDKQSDTLVLILKYYLSQMSTVFAINIINKVRVKVWSKSSINNLDVVLSNVINLSTYTIATALYWSAIMRDEKTKDLTRTDDFENLAKKYVKKALRIVENAETDAILSLLLETPTDIGSSNHQQSALDIAIEHNIHDFIHNSRVQSLISQMYIEFSYLNPNNRHFRARDVSFYALLKHLIIHPAKFYYCPVGRYWTESSMYIVWVMIVTAVAYQGNHNNQGQHYLTSKLSTTEWIMWIFNLGHLINEAQQIFDYRWDYVLDVGNYFDLVILFLWLVLFVFRFWCENIFNTDACQDANASAVLAYMFIFCIQICVLWARIALVFRTNKTVGPLFQ